MRRLVRAPVCVLVSGGLDSGLLISRLLGEGRRVVPVYVQCGLRWEAVERSWLRRFLQAVRSPHLAPLCVIDVPLQSVYRAHPAKEISGVSGVRDVAPLRGGAGLHWSMGGGRVPSARSADAAVYLPGRNLLLLTVAAIVCVERKISSIALGVLKGNPFGDATPRFSRQLSACLTQALRRPIRILTPLRHMSKAELIRHTTYAPLGLTFSCLHPQGRLHCGRCNKCAERQRAFRRAGVPDPTRYVH